jgi:hypothetical protein
MKNIISFITAALFLCSCANKVPFTSSLKAKYDIGEKTLKKIQFYTSKEIVLVQSSGNAYLYTADGKIIVNNKSDVKRIVIPKNTPCTIERVVDSDRVIVAFEYGEDKSLVFGVNQVGYYSMFAKKWNGKDGEVEYNNLSYSTMNNSGSAVLMVKLKKLNQYKKRERTVSGKKV